MHLLDANVLIALGDPLHGHHDRVQSWFHELPVRVWATCPLTENAFLRILSHPSYPQSPGPPTVLLGVLREMCSLPGHQFWPDAISLRAQENSVKLPAATHLTDFYLLALAIHRRGTLVTLDRRIDPSLLPGGPAAHFLIT
ncbi:MAG: TA system VapC family ribonuclease toxin [Terrimicrobiaceae bacterium]